MKNNMKKKLPIGISDFKLDFRQAQLKLKINPIFAIICPYET